MVRSKPVRKGTPYSVKNPVGIAPRCMYCGAPVESHWNPCWIPVSAQTTATTTSEAKERSRRILEEVYDDTMEGDW